MKKVNVAISLKGGVKVDSLELFREYFDFEELYGLLKKDSFLYEAFLKSAFPTSIHLIFFGRYTPDGSHHMQNPVDLLSVPEKCVEYYPLYFKNAPDSDSDSVSIDLHAFSEYIEGLYGLAYLKMDGGLLYDFFPAVEDFKESTKRLLLTVSDGGKKRFSPEGAVAVYIYLILHIQAGFLPAESPCFEQLTGILDQNRPLDTKTEKNIILKNHTNCFELGQLYRGNEPEDERIELVCIVNQSPSMVRVAIVESVLSRDVASGESLYVLRKAGKYLSFLPRFSVIGDTLLLLENGKLCTQWKDTTSYLDTDVKAPVCWSHSNEFGTFIIDENGRLDETNAWPEQLPSKPIMSVSAFGVDYLLLLEDGSAVSRIPKTGWDHLLYATIGLNSGIAIGANRVPLLQDGTKLPFSNVVDAHTVENHYICLDANGRIFTDSGLSVPEPVFAAAICEQGYVLAMESSLSLIDFHNHTLQVWCNIHTTEITASDDLVAYYDGGSGKVKQLAL